MGEAFVFGLLASSALVIGGALGSFWQPSTRITGAMLAFASGTLISALAFELFPQQVVAEPQPSSLAGSRLQGVLVRDMKMSAATSCDPGPGTGSRRGGVVAAAEAAAGSVATARPEEVDPQGSSWPESIPRPA